MNPPNVTARMTRAHSSMKRELSLGLGPHDAVRGAEGSDAAGTSGSDSPIPPKGQRWRIAHPVAQLLSHIWYPGADGLDASNVLNWLDTTAQDSVDEATRSLNVATRVRIPLGLLQIPSSEPSCGSTPAETLSPVASSTSLGPFAGRNARRRRHWAR